MAFLLVFVAGLSLIFGGWAEFAAAGWWPAGAAFGAALAAALLLGDH